MPKLLLLSLLQTVLLARLKLLPHAAAAQLQKGLDASVLQ